MAMFVSAPCQFCSHLLSVTEACHVPLLLSALLQHATFLSSCQCYCGMPRSSHPVSVTAACHVPLILSALLRHATFLSSCKRYCGMPRSSHTVRVTAACRVPVSVTAACHVPVSVTAACHVSVSVTAACLIPLRVVERFGQPTNLACLLQNPFSSNKRSFCVCVCVCVCVFGAIGFTVATFEHAQLRKGTK